MTTISNPEFLLGIYPLESGFTCVGTTRKGFRCRQSSIACRDLLEAAVVLDILSQRTYHSDDPTRLLPILTHLAELTLCPRWHRFGPRSQADSVADEWLMIIQDMDSARRANERTPGLSRPVQRAFPHQLPDVATPQAIRYSPVQSTMQRPAQLVTLPPPSQLSRSTAPHQASIGATATIVPRTLAPRQSSSPTNHPQVITMLRAPQRSLNPPLQLTPPPSTPPPSVLRPRTLRPPTARLNEARSYTDPHPAAQLGGNVTRSGPPQLPATPPSTPPSSSSSPSSSTSSGHPQSRPDTPDTPATPPQVDSVQIQISVTISSGGRERSSTSIIQRFRDNTPSLNAAISISPSPPTLGHRNLIVDINNDGAVFHQSATPSRGSLRPRSGSTLPSISIMGSSDQDSRGRRSQNPSIESHILFPSPQSPLDIPSGPLSISSASEQAAPVPISTPDSSGAISRAAPSPPVSPGILEWVEGIPRSPGRPVVGVSPENPGPPVQRRELSQPCPICHLDLTNLNPVDTVWCRNTCGQSVCRSCFETWTAHRAAMNQPPQCVYCRSPWIY